MSEFIKAIAYAALEDGAIQAVRINGQTIALYKIAGQVYATSEMCSHDAALWRTSARMSKMIKWSVSAMEPGFGSQPGR